MKFYNVDFFYKFLIQRSNLSATCEKATISVKHFDDMRSLQIFAKIVDVKIFVFKKIFIFIESFRKNMCKTTVGPIEEIN
jgi:hypothetical protein